MTSNDEVAPCRTCGSPASERRERQREMSLAETSPRVEIKRVCTNRKCPTNNLRDKGLMDVV